MDCDVLVIEAADLAALAKDPDFTKTVESVRKMVVNETARHFVELTSMLYNLQRDIGYPIAETEKHCSMRPSEKAKALEMKTEADAALAISVAFSTRMTFRPMRCKWRAADKPTKPPPMTTDL